MSSERPEAHLLSVELDDPLDLVVRAQVISRHAVVPTESSVADEFRAALGGDDAFELGLAALLDGIELRPRHK